MKLLLINPLKTEPKRFRIRVSAVPPMNLAILAALTPEDVEVKIVDEYLDDLNFEEEADIVGITVMTTVAPRAYRIADEFRARGRKVVLGGMHVSALPQEAIQHADAICIGEAEEYWGQLIEDFRAGELKKIYKAREFSAILKVPTPARHLLAGKRYLIPNTVQTARGCPYNCSFCSVSKFFGRKYRFRPIEDVIDEISRLKGKFVAFIDDNLMASRERAKELFRRLIPLKRKWFSQSSVEMSEDDELLDLAVKSGCKAVFIGFESLSDSSLAEIGKSVNIKAKFENAIKKIHHYGISIIGAFIFGFDNDNESVIRRTVEFAKKVKLEVVQFGILTPLPGTSLFQKLKKEKRIFDFNWSNYDIAHAVFHTKNIDPRVLEDKFKWAYRSFYSIPSMIKRLIPFKRFNLSLLPFNIAFRKYFYGRKGFENALASINDIK